MGCIVLSLNRSDSLPLEASRGNLDDGLPLRIIRSVRQQVKVADGIAGCRCGSVGSTNNEEEDRRRVANHIEGRLCVFSSCWYLWCIDAAIFE